MNRSAHGAITMDALREAGLRDKALHLIVRANQDSDHVHSNLHDGRQHFQGKRTERVVEASMEFIRTATYTAADLAGAGTDACLTMALYFMGRVFHCIQDFYAHSNWVAIGERSTFDGSHWPSNLFFCWETPGGFDGKFDNMKWFYPQPPAEAPSIKGLKTEPGEQPPTMLYRQVMQSKRTEGRENSMTLTFHRLQTRPLYHPEAHLDYEGSWASECVKAHREDGWNESGFKTAADLASLHSTAQWKEFMELQRDSSSLLEENPDFRKTGFLGSVEKMMKVHDLRPKKVIQRVGRSIEDRYRKTAGKKARERRKKVTDFSPGTIPWILMAQLRDKFNKELLVDAKGGLYTLAREFPAV